MKKILLLIAVLLSSRAALYSQSKPYNNRILVISGGGSRGAWGAGFAHYLSENYGPYKVVFATSTGSLMAPLVVLNDFETLKRGYTSITQKDIFNINPFNTKTGELKKLNAFIRLLLGKQTFGESKNLRKTIDRFVTDSQYRRLISSEQRLKFVVTVVDFNTAQAYYKSSDSIINPAQMKDWMWASSNEPLFMSYYYRDNGVFVDGGVLQTVPLAAAVDYAEKNNLSDIDIVINNPKNYLTTTTFQKRNILNGLDRLISLWTVQIRNDNLLIPQLELLARTCQPSGDTTGENRMITITAHYFPTSLYTPLNQEELLFDKERMTGLWNAGESGSEDEKPTLIAKQPIKIQLNVLKNYLSTLK